MATLSQALATGVAHHQAGRLDLAEEIYLRILAAQPDHAESLHLVGLIAHQRGQHAQAVELIRRAIALDGSQARYHSNLGEAYRLLAHFDEAIAAYRQALALDAGLPQAHNNMGEAYRSQGRTGEALDCYRRAIELAPGLAGAHNNLAVALQNLGRLEEAVGSYRRAIELEPGFAAAHNNLGCVLSELGRFGEATASCRRALELRPNFTEAYSNLAGVLEEHGLVDEASACYQRVLEFWPTAVATRSNLLFALLHRPGIGLEELAAAHAQYDTLHAAPLRPTWRPFENTPHADRPLRVGLVSADLGNHPVGYFLVGAVEHLDRSLCELVVYSDRLAPDAVTDRFKAVAGLWRDVRALDDERLAEQVRSDRVDILFDLAGHTADNRLLAMARKPAPIQITWAGYPGTTGIEAMDYLLADRYVIPPEAEPFYREKVLRMPDGYVCFDPPDDAPPVGSLPALAAGHVTFGGFHSLAKISPAVIRVWARVLDRVARSRLVLLSHGMDDVARRRLRDAFAAHGIDADRLDLCGRTSRREVLERYNRIDLALDPFPYGGGLTTIEALWMGVPVVTCPGPTFASRHAMGHLSTVGLTETIACDLDAYVQLAAGLAADLPRLASLREGLRDRVARSPLCDAPRFANNLLALLRSIWQRWCREQQHEP
jgi:predicted O-linked N-acetylglucosamine transferase (SPINDLY family)